MMWICQKDWDSRMRKLRKNIQPEFVGLLASLPTAGWCQSQRADLLVAFTAVLDYVIPVSPETKD